MSPIIILGMHRSGTSLTAGLLSRLGVYMGESRPPDAFNPTGYFEDEDFKRVNKALMQIEGHTWYRPPSMPRLLTSLAAHIETIEIACQKRAGFSHWGFKDPRTCLVVRQYHAVFSAMGHEPTYIIVRRPRGDIISSLMHREVVKQRNTDITRGEWWDLCLRYSTVVDEFLAEVCPPHLGITYPDLLKHPHRTLELLCTFLDIPHANIPRALDLIREPDDE